MAIFSFILIQKKSPEQYSGLHLWFSAYSLQSPFLLLIEEIKVVVVKKRIVHFCLITLQNYYLQR